MSDAHWYAAEGVAAAVAHAMFVQPARADIAAAIEQRDWARALASASESVRWMAVCQEVLDGRASARTGLEVDLSIAASGGEGLAQSLRQIIVSTDATREQALRAQDTAAAAEAALLERLPFELPVRRTPAGYQPGAEMVSQLEKLRHRLGLPPFEWETWVS